MSARDFHGDGGSSGPAGDEYAELVAGVEKQVAQAEEAARTARSFEEWALAVRGQGRSAGVSAQVDAHGMLTGIAFGPSTSTLGRPALATACLAAVQAAHRDVLTQVERQAQATWGQDAPQTRHMVAGAAARGEVGA